MVSINKLIPANFMLCYAQDSIDSFCRCCPFIWSYNKLYKTEVMSLQISAVRNPLSVNGTHLANVHSFKYLGSTVTYDCRMDKELDCRIQCASTYFGRLWDRLWSSHDMSNKTKISVDPIQCCKHISTTLRSGNVEGGGVQGLCYTRHARHCGLARNFLLVFLPLAFG